MKELSGVRPSGGFAVEGRSFYVWDEDRAELEAWAIELAAAERPTRCARSARLRRARAIRHLTAIVDRAGRA